MAQEASEMAGSPLPKEGAFVWTEIGVNQGDAAKCKDFYKAVFGWTFKDSDPASPMQYHEFSTGGNSPAGGLYEMDPAWFGGKNPLPPPHFLNYVLVDDVDANAKKAEGLGATVLKDPMDIPNVGRFAVIKDPTGAVFATFKPNMPGK